MKIYKIVLCLVTVMLISLAVTAGAESGTSPFVKPNQNTVVSLAYEDLAFWELASDDPAFIAPSPLKQDTPILTVISVDVGAKDCIILECEGEAILLDCGDTGAHDIVERIIKQMGIERFTAAINTHPHDDHVHAFPYILSMMPADTMYVCFPEDTNGWSKYLHREMEALSIPVVQLDIDQPMQLGSATLYFRQYDKGSDLNQRSLIIQAVLGDRSILLTADATARAFDRLIETYGPEAFHGDIVKAPHHGCDIMTGNFIRAASGMQAMFVSGYSWGDSGQDFRDQLRRISMVGTYTTLGSVVMKTDGDTWIISQLPREVP